MLETVVTGTLLKIILNPFKNFVDLVQNFSKYPQFN